MPGSRSSLVNMEARPLTSDMLTRRCVVTRLSDLTVDRFKEAVQSLGAGAVLILLPKNTSVANLEQLEVKMPIRYFRIAHNTLCLSLKILHKHCFQFWDIWSSKEKLKTMLI